MDAAVRVGLVPTQILLLARGSGEGPTETPGEVATGVVSASKTMVGGVALGEGAGVGVAVGAGGAGSGGSEV
jgi:hypothetical protein